jgi:hypothetical protein
MQISKLKLGTKNTIVSYPQYPDFKIKIGYVSKELTRKLIDSNMETKLDSNGISYTELNTKTFTSQWLDVAILGWEGLTLDILSHLMLIDEESIEDRDELVPYSKENALELYSNCIPFEQWVTKQVKDLETFRREFKPKTKEGTE